MYKLRPLQEKTVSDALAVLKDTKYRKEVVVCPTGYGKSIVIATLCNAVSDGNILVLQPSRELLSQNFSRFTEAGGQAEIYSASFKSKKIGKVTYATIGSISKEEFKAYGIKYVCIDECHLSSQNGSVLNDFIKYINPKTVLGFTASPVYLKASLGGSQLKMMNRVKGKLFSNICHVTQIKDLISENLWAPIIYNIKHTDGSKLQYNSTGSDFTKESLISNYEYNGLDVQTCLY